jgi:predicted nucleic acid-binding protein
MTEMEILDRVWRGPGEQAGKAIKATHELSVADAWITATAVTTASTLVPKDPEFRPLGGEVPLLEFPVKVTRRRARRG